MFTKKVLKHLVAPCYLFGFKVIKKLLKFGPTKSISLTSTTNVKYFHSFI